MTTKERARHDISEAFDFLRFLIKNPKEINKIPNDSEIDIVCKDLLKESSISHSMKSPKSTYLSSHTFQRV